ncbi:MAG: DUF3109 family protein [Bacteroidota bacterium]|jgi:hypothetical protein
MISIDDISVHESVPATKFACDILACKGACCTFPGGRGAPLRDDEVAEIELALPVVEALLPEAHRDAIRQNGLIDGGKGSYATQCVDGKACVFVYYDAGIAKCSIEKAFFEGRLQFRKPLSCHLFPIRTNETKDEIHFEYFSECAPALSKGAKENIPVHEFTGEALIRAFGTQWNEKLKRKISKELLI